MSGSQILTERQQGELNKAVIQYLSPLLSEENDSTLKKLTEILEVSEDSISEGIIPNYLEKKWSTVLRLQKKIIDLEAEIGNLRSAMDSQYPNNGGNTYTSKDKINWIPNSCSKTYTTQTTQLVHTVAIHPALPTIMCGCSDGSIIIWNLSNDENLIPDRIIKAHTRAVNMIKWSEIPIDITNSDNSQPKYILASSSADLSIKIWDGGSYKQIRTLSGHDHTVSSIAFSESNSSILYSVSRDKTVKVWDLTNGHCLKSFVGHSDWVRDLDVISVNSNLMLQDIKKSNSLGDFMVTCSNDQSIRLSHVDSETGLALLLGHSHVIESVLFLPMLSNSYIDKYLLENEALFPDIPQDLISNPIYSEVLGYKYCVSCSRDNTIKLWLLPPPVLRPHRSPLPSQYNNSQGWLIADLLGHVSWVKTLKVHPNGRFIFSGSDDKTIKVWDLSGLKSVGKVKCVKTLKSHEGFISEVDFAKFNKKQVRDQIAKIDKDKDFQKEVMKCIETKMKCLFVSGAVDNTVKLWS